MIFLKAFLGGGAICLIWQFLFRLTRGKVSVPWLLVVGIVSGSVLSAVGVMSKIVGWAQAGALVMVPAAGDAIYGIITAILDGAGFAVSISFLCLLAFLYVTPCIFGYLLYKRQRKLSAYRPEK